MKEIADLENGTAFRLKYDPNRVYVKLSENSKDPLDPTVIDSIVIQLLLIKIGSGSEATWVQSEPEESNCNPGAIVFPLHLI